MALQQLPDHAHVVVVGSGFAGLAAAIKLKEEGRDFVVLERGGDVGGTWRDNSYPGCACDVPSHMYSFSFAPNPDWTRAFSPQPEILGYLRRTAREFGVLPHIRFDTELVDARWDAATSRWTVTTTGGTLTADAVVLGTGGLSEPKVPELPGLGTFAGTTFHSATWRHDHDLSGERVAVVGTGASAIQFIPHVQREAAHLTVFQRTPPWVLPRRDRAIRPAERWLYRHVPAAQKLSRFGIYAVRESWILGFAVRPAIMKLAEKQALGFLRKQVPDPALRAKLTPHYRLGCKRVLLANDYYPALSRPNVDVVTDGIVEVRPHAVVTQAPDGTRTEHPVDTIIFGTGFQVTDPPIAHRLRDAAGRTLAEHWAEHGMSALHGTAVAGFPNLFFLTGPNTGLGHNSVVIMIEAQVRYVMDALRRMRARGVVAIDPKPEVQARYNARVQQDLQGTVWNSGGCASWYLDANGRNTTLWPTFTFTFMREVGHCDLDDYRLSPAAETVRDTRRATTTRTEVGV